MPAKERTRRGDEGQLDIGSLLATNVAETEAAAQARLAATSGDLEHTLGQPDAAAWAHSPYRWLRDLPAARKAKVAERLLAQHLAGSGVLVAQAGTGRYSFTINGVRVKVRLSLRWATGDYKFQQVETGEYDLAALFGISPDVTHLWVVPRDALVAAADPSTGWLAFPHDDAPAWLNAYGGELSRATTALRDLL